MKYCGSHGAKVEAQLSAFTVSMFYPLTLLAQFVMHHPYSLAEQNDAIIASKQRVGSTDYR